MSSETAWHCSETPEAEYAARKITKLMRSLMPDLKTVADVGCGVGTCLRAFSDGGAEISGFDAGWVDQERLVIPKESFTIVDLATSLNLPDLRFDLLLCLEVAEHLPESRAASLVADLTQLSDTILFSAAIPGQGGVGHINEQWQSYWAGLFESQGYTAHTAVRDSLWNDPEIPVWYKQNNLLYTREALDLPAACPPVDIVHPEQYLGVHVRDVSPGQYFSLKIPRLLGKLGIGKDS